MIVARFALLLLIAGAGFLIIVGGLLYFFQERLIYYPRSYRRVEVFQLPVRYETLKFTTSQGAQEAYYYPPTSDASAVPRPLWVTFGGNASLALHWSWIVEEQPHPGAGFLLVEYPSYGRCAGRPTPETIQESALAALEALAAHLDVEIATLQHDINVVGHSLGAAAGLNFAATQPVRRLFLLSPFTSMHDMARRVVGWPLALCLRHQYDNVARLDELAARDTPPAITVIHSRGDHVVPYSMSERLAQMFPEMIELVSIDGHHDSPVDALQVEWYTLLELEAEDAGGSAPAIAP